MKRIRVITAEMSLSRIGNPMAKKKRIPVLLVILVFLCLSGLSIFLSGFPAPTPPKPTPPPPGWFTDWLHSPFCQPPCWQGITPGVTTMTETVKIIQDLPWIQIDYGPGKSGFETSDLHLEWSFISPSTDGGMAFANDNGLISYLFLKGYLSTPLQEVIDSYGFPSYVFIDSCDMRKCSTQLIYVESGLRVNLFLDWDRDDEGDVIITPTDEVMGIEFFAPGEQGYLRAYPQFSESFPRGFHLWTGYSKYRF